MNKYGLSEEDVIKFGLIVKDDSEEGAHRIQLAKDRYARKAERKSGAKRFFKMTFYTPISLGLRVASIAAKILGVVTALGLPYGIYSAYRIVRSIIDKLPLEGTETHHYGTALLFLVLPFVAFFASNAFKHLSDHLIYKRDS